MITKTSQSWIWWHNLSSMAKYDYFIKWRETLPFSSPYKNVDFPTADQSKKVIEYVYNYINE